MNAEAVNGARSQAVFQFPVGSEGVELASARYAAWREGTLRGIHMDVQHKTAESNRVRQTFNDSPPDQRKEINQERKHQSWAQWEWPVPLLEAPECDESWLPAATCKLAEAVCRMTKAEIRELRGEFAERSGSLGHDEFSEVQERLCEWERAESWRDERERIETARRTAAAIIENRATIPDIEGLEFSECLGNLGPEGGEFTRMNVWATENLAKLSENERAEALVLWGKHERMLPVYYEYARQSVKLLHLGVMHQTVKKELPDDKRDPQKDVKGPRLGGCLMHPLDSAVRSGIKELHSRIGGFAEAIIRSLGGHLVEDRAWPLIPLRERKWAVSYAIRCNESHRIMGPELSDAGPVADPWVAPLVGHDDVRLAYKSEATTTANILYRVIIAKEEFVQSIGHEDVIRFDGALNATTRDGAKIGSDGKKQWKRVMDDNGGEIIAFRVNWRETRNSDLVDQFRGLIEELRPKAQWKERAEMAGKKAPTGSAAALDALVKLRARRASEIEWRRINESKDKLEAEFREQEKQGWPNFAMRDEAEARLREIEAQMKDLWQKHQDSAVNGGKRAIATKCFAKITGDDEKPWWA